MASSLVYAQALEEVIVSANKRSEILQEVPIAISAFSASAIQERGLTDVAAMSKLIPNATIDSGSFAGGSSAVLSAYIRGIGQSEFAFNFDPGVGVYLDGYYLGRMIGANSGLFDVERLEVLKGPQGTLFGRNSVGGAINVITKTPSDSHEFIAEMTVGRFNRADFQGYINVPFTQSMAASLAFSSKSRDGYMDRDAFDTTGYNVSARNAIPGSFNTPDSEGGQEEQAFRGKFRFSPSENFQAVIAADYTRIDSSNLPQTLLAVTPGGLGDIYNACLGTPAATLNAIGLGGACLPFSGNGVPRAGVNVDGDPTNDLLPWDGRYLTGDEDRSYATGPSNEDLENQGIHLTMDFTLTDHLDLTSLTSYRDLKWASVADLDGSPLEWLAVVNKVEQYQMSQEFQFVGDAFDGDMEYVAGAYYFKEDAATDDIVPIAQMLAIEAPADIKTEALALFTNIRYRLTDSLGLTLGARYTEEDKSIYVGQRDANALSYKLAPGCYPVTDACRVSLGFPNPADPLAYGPAGRTSKTFYDFSPKVGFEWHISDGGMLYGSYAKGYKTGGWTTRLSNPVAALPAFDPEQADSYELGYKADMFNGRVRTNVAAFYTDYQDIQLNFQEGVSPVIKNAGDADIQGFEGEATVIVTDNLTLRAMVGYLDAEYSEVDPGAVGVSTSSELPRTPEWKYGIGPQYDLPLSRGDSLRFLVDYSYASSTQNDTENTALLERESVEDLSASVTYVSADKWQFTVGGTNLLDDRYLTTGQNQGGANFIYGTYNRPREWYARLRYEF